MTAKDFRRIALGMEGAIESSHMDHPDFRVGNRIFATLTHDEQMGMVALPPGEVQHEFIRAHPSAFSMVNGACSPRICRGGCVWGSGDRCGAPRGS